MVHTPMSAPRAAHRATATLLALLLLLAGPTLTPRNATAQDRATAQATVDAAAGVVNRFRADPNMGWLREHLPRARGVLIVPELVKGGFIFGGSGGQGVLLGRRGQGWSEPAFYNMGSVTFGLQIGAEVAEVMLLIMTDRGMDAMYSPEFKLGADVSVAAGPVGAGAKAATTDVLAFSRAKGVFGGLTLEGAGLAPEEDLNLAYHGKPLRPVEIIASGMGRSGGASALHRALGGGGAAASAAGSTTGGGYDLLTIQRGLVRAGYDPGRPDGRYGPATRRAIEDYQAANGLPVDGKPSLALQRHLAGG